MEVFTTIDQKNLNLASSSALGAEALGFDGIYSLENLNFRSTNMRKIMITLAIHRSDGL